MSDEPKSILAILTLERHKDGVWISRLKESLHKVVPSNVQIIMVVLEDHLEGPFAVSQPYRSPWWGLVNRVSDAAEPWEAKAALAVLQVARLIWKIPVWNGVDAYSLCTHKWCHHCLFAQAGLASPDTIASLQKQAVQSTERGKDELTDNPEIKSIQMLSGMQPSCKQSNNNNIGSTADDEEEKTLDYLVKPNAGGFGSGIERRKAKLKQQTATGEVSTILLLSQSPLPKYSDRMVLFQSYIPPRNGKIYRVWFLRGKVQCAVERTVAVIPQDSTSEFTSGCVGGVCSRASKPKPSIQPWSVPEPVRMDIEQQLLPVLPRDVHCGSVEFLYHQERRLYFDLNLLSTLPVDDQSTQDPWIELANAIWEFVCEEKADQLARKT